MADNVSQAFQAETKKDYIVKRGLASTLNRFFLIELVLPLFVRGVISVCKKLPS